MSECKQCEPVRERAVGTAVQTLSETIGALSDATITLTESLAPILAADTPCDAANDIKQEPRCELEGQIICQHERVKSLVRQVRDLVSRLEV